MIMFYDVMIIDDDLALHQPYRERRRLLERLVTPIRGKAGITWQKHVQFSKPDGPKRLKEALAHAFVRRWEGLVLKPSDEPYFDLERPVKGRHPSRWIKLKKDCIEGLGDSADFAVVAAGYDVREASRLPDLDLKWTHFYIGCLRNKETVLQSGAKPQFLIFDKICDCLKKEDLVYLNQHGQFPLRSMEPGSLDAHETYNLDFAAGLPRPKVIFRKPFVFDVAGSGFDKSPDRDIFTLRFPRVLKLHRDRDWRQAVGLDELQAIAIEAMTTPKGDLSEELAEWIGKLDRLDRGANGQMPSWDYTDDEDEELEVQGQKLPPVSAAKPTRRAQMPVAPPLVRMDTGEMQDKEYRLSTGEVVDRSTSKHLVASITSDGALQNPPRSSQLSRGTDLSSKHLSPPSLLGKRTVESTDLEEASRTSKKARPSLLRSKRDPKGTDSSNTPTYGKPLREITSSACASSQSPGLKRLPQTKQPSTTDFSLVRKIAVDADEHLYGRSNKRRKILEPSSPSRETVASESTTAATTQQTLFYDALSPPPSSPGRQQKENSIIPTPPSTAENPVEQAILGLKKRQLILSPCLMDHKHPLKELLAKQSIEPSDFPSTTPFPASASPKHSIIFLVEPADRHLTGKHIWSLVRHIPAWHPRLVRVWDWRIAEAMLKDEVGDTGDRKKRVKEAFYAKLSWDPEKETVEVRWREGEVSRMRKEDLKRADWSGCQ